MKTLSAGMQSLLASRVTTLAWGMRVIRRGGEDSSDDEVTGWTDHHKEKTVTIDGESLTLDPDNAIDMSSLARSSGFGVDNLEATVVLLDDTMTKADLLDGAWSGAEFLIFQYDWATPANGTIPWIAGTFGRVKPKLGSFVIELRDLRQFVQQDTTRITGANCDFDFGDDNCTVDLAPHTYSGTVTSVGTQYRVFTASALAGATDKFTQGKITWLTGANTGSSRKVRGFITGGVITLVLPMIRGIEVGDTFSIIAGCLKRREDCIAYANVLNFPGFDQKQRSDAYLGGGVVE